MDYLFTNNIIVNDYLRSISCVCYTVTASIIITHHSTQLNFISESNYDLSFNTSNFMNSSSRFYWQKDGRNVAYQEQKYRGTATNTLTLLKAATTDEGMYSLIITQNQNVVIASLNVNISIIGKLMNIYNMLL